MVNTQISIIVPAYNVEEYLPDCIESILAQSFADFELILVDDGSTDRSGAICDKYTEVDARIRVFHKPNGGVSSARNIGLQNARGEWIVFVDGDDVIPPDALKTLIKLATPDIDMVMAGYEATRANGIKSETQPNIISKYITWELALAETFKPTDFGYQGYCFSKLYRTSIIKDNALSFNENIKFNEDRLFVVNFICRSKRNVAYTTKDVYSYFLREGGTMSSLSKGYNKDFATDFDAFLLMCDIVKASTRDKTLRKYFKSGLCGSYKANHKMMISSNAYDRNIHSRMLKGLISKGALLLYVKQELRSCIGNIAYCSFLKSLPISIRIKKININAYMAEDFKVSELEEQSSLEETYTDCSIFQR